MIDEVHRRPVHLTSAPDGDWGWLPLLAEVAGAVGDVPRLLALAEEAGRSWPLPGEGRTAELWELLASVAAVDVAAGRVFEPHLDAQAILAQAKQQAGQRHRPAAGTWGVFAAEGPDMRLAARWPSTKRTPSGWQTWACMSGSITAGATMRSWVR